MNKVNSYQKSIKKRVGFGFLLVILMMIGISLGFVCGGLAVYLINPPDNHIFAIGFLFSSGPVLFFLGLSHWFFKKLGFELSDFGMK